MAFIDDLYIFVEDEQMQDDVETSQHSVEKGLPTTDTVKRTPIEISLTGAVVDYKVGGKTYQAGTTLSQIRAKKNAGALITYSGRNYGGNFQIKTLSTGHNNKIAGGATFNMTLQQCNIATNAYVPPKESSIKDGGNQQVDKGRNKEVWYTVKKGDCVWTLVVEKKVNGKWAKADYANLKRIGGVSGMSACNWVLKKNPHAFSRKNDFRTLQIGAKILLGTR